MELCVLSNDLNACETTPILNPSRFVSHVGRFGLREGFAVGSTAVRANGTMWALNLEDHKSELRRLQNRELPELLAGSPPRDDFSSLLNASLKPEEINAMRTQKIEPQIITCVQACKLQMEVQKHFIHAHTKNFTSWRMPEVQSLASDPRVYSFVGPTHRLSMKA